MTDQSQPDPRPDVLRAMGWKESDTDRCFVYGQLWIRGADTLWIESWHPGRSLDDVAIVEWWICRPVEQGGLGLGIEYEQALLVEIVTADGLLPWTVKGDEWHQHYLICATAERRWQACLTVMRQAGLIPQGE